MNDNDVLPEPEEDSMEFPVIIQLFLNDPTLLDSAIMELPDPDKLALFGSIALAFKERFDRTTSIDDIDRAISLNREALKFTSTGSPDYAFLLSNLSVALQSRFEQYGSISDLDQSIATAEQAVASITDDSPEYPGLLNNLGNVLQGRYEQTGSLDDLDRAVDMNDDAVRLTPSGHPNCPKYLNNLAIALCQRFERTEVRNDLTRAISAYDLAMAVTSEDDPNYVPMLSNLGSALHSQFRHTDAIGDIDRAIILMEKAVELTAINHPHRIIYLNALALALQDRFDRMGSIQDLDRAIEKAEEAVALTPASHFGYAINLNNLGNALQARFEQIGSMDDVDRAIEIHEKAVAATPDDHPDRANNLNSLARALRMRFNRRKSIEDLERAIEIHEKTVELIPIGHPHRAGHLSNLASAFQNHYDQTGSTGDLDRAIAIISQAAGSEKNERQLASIHLNLGALLSSYFGRTGLTEYLDRAIASMEQALTLTPMDHPDRVLRFKALGDTLIARFEKTGSIDDLQKAIEMYVQAVAVDTAPPSLRIKAADSASRLLIGRDHSRARPLLRTAVELLPIIGSRTLAQSDRQYNLSQFGGITSRAASISLECGEEPYEALQLLEIGRGVLASLQLEVRSDITALKASYPDIAQQFENIRERLDRQQNQIMEPSQADIILEGGRRRLLSKQFDTILRTIRGFEGFERFLLGPSEGDLKALAKYGPIVFLNVSEVRSDAFLVESQRIRSLRLPQLNHNDLDAYSKRFLYAVQPMNIKSHSTATSELDEVLKWLWNVAVGPILDELGFKEPPIGDKWPRVWWIGSGLLSVLPIHAAGHHSDGSARTAIDRVISSYVPYN